MLTYFAWIIGLVLCMNMILHMDGLERTKL